MPVSQFNVDENSDRTNNCMTGLYPVILQYSDGVILGNTAISHRSNQASIFNRFILFGIGYKPSARGP